MKTFEQFMEHHQKDAQGRVVEHGDGTPSSVEEKFATQYKDKSKLGQSSQRKSLGRGSSIKDGAKKSGYESKKEHRDTAKKLAPYQTKGTYNAHLNTEAKVDTVKKLDDEGKEDARNLRKYGTKHNQFMQAVRRRGEHRSERGVKKIKGQKPAPKGAYGEETILELNRYGKETGKATGSINKRAGTPVKKGGSTDDKALTFVRNMIRKETGRPEGQRKKVKGEKGKRQIGDRKFSPADTIAKRRASKAAADAAMMDTRGT